MTHPDNKRSPNCWLNMQVSVEEKLTFYRQQRRIAYFSCGNEIIGSGNPWLNGILRVESVLAARIPAIGTPLTAPDGVATRPLPEVESCPLSEQVMPMLARIHQRIAAQRRLLEKESQASLLLREDAEDALDIALRALRRRRSQENGGVDE